VEVEQWQAEAESGRRSHDECLEMFGDIAEFLSIWQVDDPGDPEFGGLRRGEFESDTVETHYTSEAIWAWSRYRELTGDDQYYQDILDALGYSMDFPAYLEEGGEDELTGYYRMYSCAWAVRAELKFRDVYGDNAYRDYSDSCASYIRHHTLICPETGFYHDMNPPVLSWALGNLYLAGVHEDNAEWRAEAVRQAADKVKVWVEEEPALLGSEVYAYELCGGATMWGLLNSFFSAYPESIEAWVPMYKDYVDTFADIGDFQNAWNAWNALAHRAIGQALSDPFHLGVHLTLTDTLMAEDGDGDGGIPGRPPDTDSMDQTSTTCYLAFMGLDPFLGPASAVPESGAPGSAVSLRLSGWPIPTSSDLRLTFELPRGDEVQVAIYDCAGRRVALLASGPLGEGQHGLTWHGNDDCGRRVTSGAYYAILRTSQGRQSREILWVR
jgi:hypothetical protein